MPHGPAPGIVMSVQCQNLTGLALCFHEHLKAHFTLPQCLLQAWRGGLAQSYGVLQIQNHAGF